MTAVDNKNGNIDEVTPDWCLLTAHETGQLVLWKPDPLSPLLRIKEKDSPIKYYFISILNLIVNM